ncbi:PD-(D/E)XK nuclease-like domain-containing protein [Nocardia brasiliensis]|uniref:PD-(D/E)XK nuclease-like domain-containing protein n=1 Tax=Nocardia brasiliensis TaxID=37326 RepID=UPI0024552875|nr:PD-(D/E)XK nuclease-like domain-containing protein [Nocardia brasiliensis]
MNDICLITDLDREACWHCRPKLEPVAPREPGMYAGVDEREYHADPALSSSGAKRLREVTPWQWRWERDNPRTASSDAFDLGTAVHTLTLGTGAPLVDLGVDEIRTNKAKAARQAAWDAGAVPLRSKDYQLAADMAAAVKRNPRAQQLLASGVPELSAWVRDAETGVMLRARADWVHWIDSHTAVIVDLKTSSELDPAGFRKSVARFRYYCQQPWYQGVFEALGITTVFVFLVVCDEPPHAVYVVELAAAAVELGERENRRAIELYARCLAADEWPGHGHTIHEIDLPAWIYKQEEYAQ